MRRFHPRTLALALGAASLLLTESAADDQLAPQQLPAAAERTVDFAEDIAPLLRQSCFSCHGAEQQEAGLRLDLKSRALQGGDGGKVILPGNSADSRLVQAVAGLDEDLGMMPPEGEGTPLTTEQIALLRAWIDQGASWPASADEKAAGHSHWAFQPIAAPPPPQVKNQAWVRNPIDSFVLARLEAEGIEPAPEADRATLIRRLYLDLLGLPPTPQQVDAFLADERTDAYQRLVDRVLGSEHYGERWARHWLDLARYADSDGYEKDRPRPHAWRYRQWVIEALNADMPFDRFTVAQIAGDLLPEARVEQQVATGFHRNTLHNTEGGTDQEEDRVKKTVDRTNTVGTVWLGLTLGCAQCHSHKYDPITQREYYSMYAFFNQLNEKDIPAPQAVDRQRYASAKAVFDREHAQLQAAVRQYEQTQLAAAQQRWEQTATQSAFRWMTLEPSQANSRHGANLETQADQSILATGTNQLSDVYTVQAKTEATNLRAIRLEVLPDERLPKQGPGRAENGNFVLTTIRLTAQPADGSGAAVDVDLQQAQANFSQKDWDVGLAINDNPQDGWAVSPRFGERHVAVFAAAAPFGFPQGSTLTLTLDQTYQGSGAHNLGRFRLAITASSGPLQLEGIPAEVAEALDLPADQRNEQQQQAIASYWQSIDPELARLKAVVEEHAKRAPKPSDVKAQAVTEQSPPRPTHIHLRGDFLSKGEPVQEETLAVLPPLSTRGDRPDRLDLARWLVADDHPLTARVTVNRLWQRHFGRGIVLTSDDFGSQGEPPSHPGLLDWLANQLRQGGWKLKRIHRLIVTSATYRQSSAARPELNDRDPENALLARQVRQRVEAELVRDLALAVSGLLDPRVGGPSVRPPQPSEYSALTYANSAKWQESQGGDRYRRGLYTFFQRTSPYPMLMTFDSPDSNQCTARRSVSNTPLQALTLWNDRVFYECAQHLGRRIVAEAPRGTDADSSTRQRAVYAFQLCLARQPNDQELQAVLDLFQQQTELSQRDEKAAAVIVGSAPRPQHLDLAELAGWVAVGRVLINLDEFVTRE